MRALVTGAGGFIGAHVVSALVSEGAEVWGFDRSAPPDGTLPEAVEFVAGDVLDPAAARRVHTSSCATCGPVPGRSATERDLPPLAELRLPYKRTKREGERLALQAAREGGDVVVVNPTVPVGPGDLRPTPTGKMIVDAATGVARGYLARSALNVVAVEDVAAGHLAALERGRPGERYLLGGENLLVRDEVRAGRLPHLFDDAKARAELGYVSRRPSGALTEAARAAVGV